jgi:cyclic pyranopterin monophosphate synthase
MNRSTKKKLSHVDAKGRARMVDVGHKPPMQRVARAAGFIQLQRSTLQLLQRRGVPKGDVLAVAQVAGIQAAKDTARLIPLCHTLPLDSVKVDFRFANQGLEIESEVSTTSKTGVEMEALTAVSVAALTIYDMCKAIDGEMQIGSIRVVSKIKKTISW